MAATKKSTAQRSSTTTKPTKQPAKKATAKKQATASTKKVTKEKKEAPATAAAKKAAPKKAAPKKAAPKKAAATTTKAAPAKQQAAPEKQEAASRPSKRAAGTRLVAATTSTESPNGFEIPAPRGTTKEGIAYTKDFDVKFLKAQHDLLVTERSSLLSQAGRLEDEANSLIEDGEMGDVQFDDESGEGDTMVVERERDLALSAQARQTIADIDAALTRMNAGTYGYSVTSGRPIPRERLEAIPWATVLVEEKVGGIGRR